LAAHHERSEHHRQTGVGDARADPATFKYFDKSNMATISGEFAAMESFGMRKSGRLARLIIEAHQHDGIDTSEPKS
jgi:hypothetical protein